MSGVRLLVAELPAFWGLKGKHTARIYLHENNILIDLSVAINLEIRSPFSDNTMPLGYGTLH